MKEGKSPTPSTSSGVQRSGGHYPDFSLAIAARALAASTVSYLKPQARGMTFTAYDAIVKDTLLPPFSNVVSNNRIGKDLSHNHNDDKDGINVATNESVEVEQALQLQLQHNDNDGENTNTGADKNVKEEGLQSKFKSDYELFEKYDRSGKQKVRCLVAVVHGRVAMKDDGGSNNDQNEFLPGSISMSFRGTDTLENVMADVKAITVQYDDAPFIPSGVSQSSFNNATGLKKVNMKNANVHRGFRDAWYGDDLRKTVLQYVCDKINKLHEEIQNARDSGLVVNHNHSLPTIEIVGHSLGGSIAIIAAFDLAKSLTCLESSKQAHLRVYTMGCPRVGNARFAKLFNKLVPDCWNVINDNDIVPAIPHWPSIVRSRLPVFCPCRETGYRRHERTVILKDYGGLVINPSKRMKYRREAKVLRLTKAIDSHKTCNYRDNIRAAIRNEIDDTKQSSSSHKSSLVSWMRNSTSRTKHKEECQPVVATLQKIDNLLAQLEEVINEARSDPNRSFRLLPGAT